MSDYECPYCGNNQEHCDDPLREGERYEVECSECEKKFLLSCTYSVDYNTEKSDCLNGDIEHRFFDKGRMPFVRFGMIQQRCITCPREKFRTATQEEIDRQIEHYGESIREITLPRPTQQGKEGA